MTGLVEDERAASAARALRSKALAVLREGRLIVRHARTYNGGDGRPSEVVAAVRSSRDGGPTYAVDLIDGVATCTCRDGGDCAHVAAVALVTGGQR